MLYKFNEDQKKKKKKKMEKSFLGANISSGRVPVNRSLSQTYFDCCSFCKQNLNFSLKHFC